MFIIIYLKNGVKFNFGEINKLINLYVFGSYGKLRDIVRFIF